MPTPNWLQWGLGTFEKFSKYIPGAGPFLSDLTGQAKDLLSGPKVNLDDLASDVGDLKNGLAGAKAQIETQGKELHGKIDEVKSELQNQLTQQGAKFDQDIKNLDAKIATLSGDLRKQAEEQKKALENQKEELKRDISELSDELNRVENKLTEAINDLRNEVNERFAEQEQKILNNKRKIEEERLQREEEIRETHSKIKLTNTNLENLRQEKSQLEDEFLNYKSSINQKTADTQQTVEDLEAEYQRKTKILEAKIEDNQEQLEEFNEQLINTQREQARSRLERQEIFEELQETNDLLHFQKHQTNLVAQQMEEVSDEIHERMSKIGKDHHKLFTLAQDTSQKLGNLTEQVSSISQKTVELEQQVKENKEATERAKKEAKLANERLDNYIKSQKLLDTSAAELVFNKIQKSLELKAEETKLLTTLKLLQETKKLIKPKPAKAKKDWKVGVQTGTVDKNFPEPEGFVLKPGSYWEKKYTGDQVKPDNPYQLFSQEWFNWEKENKLSPEETKFEPWGQRVHSDNESAPLTDPEKRKEQETALQQTENEEKQAEELFFEQLEAAKSEILTRLAEIQQEIKQNLTTAEKQKSTASNSQPKAKTTPANFAEELEQQLQEAKENSIKTQQKDLEKDWESIQDLSEQVLQEKSEKEQSELDVNEKLQELTQQIQETEANLAASQKQMSKWMLFVLIFLLEYVVYKKQGVLGLAVLNTLLLIAYNYREQLKQYADLWNKYLLIIGYVIGNTLAYSVPEQEKYKWPSVTAFNLIIAGIYAYTLYQQKQEQAKLETVFNEKTAQICQENNITSEAWKSTNIQPNLLSNYSPFSNSFTATKEQQLTNLQEIIREQELINQKALELQQQSELLQKSAQIENNLKAIHSNLGEPRITWNKIKQKYPEFTERSILLNELALADKLLNKSEVKATNQSFLTKLARISAISPEENNLLSQLRLTLEQFIAISYQAHRFTKAEKEWLSDNYVNLTSEQQLSLLNSGLNVLGIDDLDKKEVFVQLNHTLYQERNNFGLNTKEKEQILRLLVNTLNLTAEQQTYLESMGISFFNASEWVIDSDQKNHLLSFGLQKINLTENQQENLLNLSSERLKTFALTEEQKNILSALAPLTRKDKYSPDNWQLLNSLQLKSTSLNFLTSEEIIPDPNLEFGETKSPYLPLKIKFLLGEQKILTKQQELQEKQQKEEEIKQKKLSILESLMNWADEVIIGDYLSNFNYSLTDWVKEGVLTNWQTDILLTCGFKTVPKYNFFELLIFSVEKFAQQNWTEFLQENEELVEEFAEYLNSLKNQPITFNKFIWEKYVSSQSPQQRETIKNLNLEEIINQKISQALAGYQPQEEVFYDISEELEEEEKVETKPTSSTSRYDSLLDNLSKEDAEREKKKQERQAAKNKFEETERNRREQKLTEKDRKLKEDEEKRQKEKELAEKEEKKRREAEEARFKALQEEQERIFNQKIKNQEEAKKRAEEALENQKKANELAEQKKKDEIKKLEKENELEQERLTNQAKLIEEEKQKKLASIALEDQEQRQLIEKRANEKKARIQQEMADKKRKNEEELKRKENELLRQQQAQQVEIQRLEKERELQTKMGQELTRLANEQTRILRENKNSTDQLRAYRESIWNYVLDYYWASSESGAGTQNPTQYSGGNLRSWLSSYPSMKFNLVHGDKYSCNWTNNSWKLAMKAFYGVAGNSFVDQWEFRRLLEQKVLDMHFLDRIQD